ncbi:MAG TPA: hypothetical protein VF719_01445, partial [Abditibacteriaceae bacterium]
EGFEGACFEVLEDYWALGDARLSAFASHRLWAIAVEAVRYSPGMDLFCLDVWLYGNCLRPRESFTDLTRQIFVVPNSTSLQEVPFSRDGFSIRWRGTLHHFTPMDDELQAAGILLSKNEQLQGVLSPSQALRYICHKLDHPFFASEDTLRDLIDKNCFETQWKSEGEGEKLRAYIETPIGRLDEFASLGCDLRLLLQTGDWCHPCVGIMPEDKISVREALGPLAKTIATGDLSHWQSQDPTRFNSHWSYWTETEHAAEARQFEYETAVKEEGERFQAWLKTRPLDEQDEMLRSLKQEWRVWKQEEVTLEDLPFCSVITIPPTLTVDEQTFSLGPHLWGEMQSEESLPHS